VRVKGAAEPPDTNDMWARYFSRPDLDLGGDATFAFGLGLAVLMVTQRSGAFVDLSPDAAVLVARFAGGAMLLATFVGGVAIGRSLAVLISR
jgi:hypothetical protein